MTDATLDTCPGCGLELAEVETPSHAYLGASPSCFALYGELIARRYTEFRSSPRANKLVVDAYAVQHPGVPERRSIQSVNVHLVALYLQLEKGYKSEATIEPMQRLIELAPPWKWLDPPHPNGDLTVWDLLQTNTEAEYQTASLRYAQSVWQAWQGHRAAVLRSAQLVEGG